MGLRTQLALIGLVTLALPWAGCQYLRETEDALRQAQQTLLLDTGASIAALLAERPQLFPRTRATDHTVYAHDIGAAPVLDGFAEEWDVASNTAPLIFDGMQLLAGYTQRYLYLFLDVTAPGDAADKRIEIASATGVDELRRYVFQPVAPGPLTAERQERRRSVPEPRVQAWWTPTSDGFNLEVRLPRDLAGDKLGVRVLQQEGAGLQVIATTYQADQPPGRLAAPSAELDRVLRNYLRPGLELAITDAAGWRLARAGSIDTAPPAGGATLATRLYRTLIGDVAGPMPADSGTGRVDLPWVDQALGGEPRGVWRRAPVGGQAIASAATPIRTNGEVIGTVVMKESSAAILTLTNRALSRLTSLTLIATLAVALALLGYATWLSLRITRLSRAADRAMSSSGRIRAGLPSAAAADELGDLSRSFSRLLARVQETNEYLRTLGAKLSHELRTPLAVVTSSLDNLERVGLSREQEDFALRARDGARRLQTILNAMSEASRTEQAVTGAEPEAFDLAAVLASAAGGYADAYPERQIRLSLEAQTLRVRGVPELLVQMLDKLVANAVEFSDRGDTVEIDLGRSDGLARITVRNPGPPLPEDLRERIFDSLVSVRRRRGTSHLGLGLYIARLIVESHGGSIEAENLPDGGGVEFTVTIPLATQAVR